MTLLSDDARRYAHENGVLRAQLRKTTRALQEALDAAPNLVQWQAAYHLYGIPHIPPLIREQIRPPHAVAALKYEAILCVLIDAQKILDFGVYKDEEI